MTSKERRRITLPFKNQFVQLVLNGKPRNEVIREYELTSSSFDKRVKQYQKSGSFSEKDNRFPEEQELIKLRKKTCDYCGE
jgi:transposase